MVIPWRPLQGIVLGCVLGLGLCACGDPPPGEPASRSLALHCTCDDVEDCPACFRKIGVCCYGGDDTIGGKAPSIARRCESDPACEVCCAECAQLSCEDLIARNSCPPVPPG